MKAYQTRFARPAHLFILLLLCACHSETRLQQQQVRPSILLVTLDTTRYDAVRPDIAPKFNALAKRGTLFKFAYTTVPQTLAAHTSMMTGLYPAGHGVHENGRYLSNKVPVLAEQMKANGYRTAAFISAFALAKRFGLGRGFDVWDENFGNGRAERNAKDTTDRVLAYLAKPSTQPLFLWVHYYDPHFPYAPPPPYHGYLGEVSFMDSQLGRLAAAFHGAMIIVGDHGEGLGDHGEPQHGNLMFQATMHVPLLLIGPGVAVGTNDEPVSTRRIFHTIRDWAGIDSTHSLRKPEHEVVVAESMKPFLDYGWQPQVMAVDGRFKTISDGAINTYDVVADPGEMHSVATISREVRIALQQYPLPTAAPPPTDEESRKQLASLGYVAGSVQPVIRKDAPRPAAMTALFPVLDDAARLFVEQRYRECVPLLQKILKDDPYNLDSALRLATAYSELGRNADAEAAFKHAQAIAPGSQDVDTYLALFYAKGKQWPLAEPLLERVLAQSPDRLPALEAMAVIRERQGRLPDAIALLEKIYTMRTPTSAELANLGHMAMETGETNVAINAFENACRSGLSPTRRAEARPTCEFNLELGVLYLAAGRFQESRDALDRIPPNSPQYPMALFKRAQVSVLLHEPDAPARIAAAREHADGVTGPLIERERLFR